MRILHFYHGSESMITQYVSMLCDAMKEYAETAAVNSLATLRKQLSKQRPDIIHLHGCWNMTTAIAARTARKKGIRTVITPHGQLEQWIIRQRYWKEKLPKMLLYQKNAVHRAYSVIAMGRMEENGLKRLKWNTRIETVRNPLITETVSNAETAIIMRDLYQKVLDTDVLKLMDTATANSLRPLIKAGQTGSHLWLTDNEYNAIKYPDEIDWRKILIYSTQEKIIGTVRQGMEVLNIPIPDIPISETACYYPDRHTAPRTLTDEAGVASEPDANKRIAAIIKQARTHVSHRDLAISHIVELATELRESNIEDDKVTEMLAEHRLSKFAGRLMHILSDMAGLDEGFMPISVINDKKAQKIKTIITKHLEI